MLISELRQGSVTSTKGPSRSSSRPGCRQVRSTSVGSTGDLRITVVANPQGTIAPLALCTLQPVELPMVRAGPSAWSVPAVSLALLPTTGCRSLHRRVSWSFWRGRFGCTAAPVVAMPDSDLEMTAMLSRTAFWPPLSGARHHMAPASRSMEPPCVAPGRDAADLSGLPPAVVETIIQAIAPSTRQTYALKWSLFANWCSSRREDPRRCTIGVVLSFLQERLERMLSPSTLKVYVAAIVAHHDAVDGRSLGSMISSWVSWRGPGGWIPPGHPLCPLGTTLSSWLDFRGVPLSRWTQSSWSSCLLRQRSWPRSLPSKGRGPPGVFG